MGTIGVTLLTGASLDDDDINESPLTYNPPNYLHFFANGANKVEMQPLVDHDPTSRPPIIVNVGIQGMTCASCVGMVESSVKSLPGIRKCAVSLLSEKAEIVYDPTQSSEKDIIGAIEDLGFTGKILPPEAKPGLYRLMIDGMTCTSCSNMIESCLLSIPGVQSATVNFATKQATIHTDHDIAGGVRVLISEIESLGFSVTPCNNQTQSASSLHREKEIALWRRRFLISLIFAGPTVLIAMSFMSIPQLMMIHYDMLPNVPFEALLTGILATPVQFYCGLPFYQAALKVLRKRHANMDVLISVGSLTAYIYSVLSILAAMLNPHIHAMPFFETSAALITFVLLGRYLENIAKGKTSEALVKLMELQSKTAILLDLDPSGAVLGEHEINADLVQPGDILKVIPGARIPSDGSVTYGQTTVDESMLTGESLPVHKQPRDIVSAGTLNVDGMIYIKAERVGSESTIAQIIKLVEEAQTSKAPIQALADKIAGYFVPAIVGIAFIVWLAWFIAGVTHSYPDLWRGDYSAFVFSLIFGISVLVVACPCSMGLATPTAVMVGIGVGAKLGILIKGGKALETAHKVSAVLFDKTGTLTKGKLAVTDVAFSDNVIIKESEFFMYVGAAESNSEHPIGKALVKYAIAVLSKNKSSSNIIFPEVHGFISIPGRGLQCTVSIDSKTNHVVNIGNLAYFSERSIPVEESMREHAEKLEENGKTVIYVARDDILIGVIGLSDIAREEAYSVIRNLHQIGIHTYMITGDNHRAARYIADIVGIPKSNIFAQVIPKEKAQKVKELQQAGQVVCFVGDGLNDSPALAQADLGIALGAGTDVAVESADIVLIKDDLNDVIHAIDLSRTTFHRIQLNFIFAFAYNFLSVPIAAGVLFPWWRVMVPPMVAAVAMMCSSLSVLASSLSLKKYKKQKIDQIRSLVEFV